MFYFSEFAGCYIFLVMGYAYMCNVKLKNTLIKEMKIIELVVAWGLACGFGIAVASSMGGSACLNPGVAVGYYIMGSLDIHDTLLYILMEFLAAGCAVLTCVIFFFDSFKESIEEPKACIFSAGPVKRNLIINFIQEFLATFVFLFMLFITMTYTENAVMMGIVAFGAVTLLGLTLNSTGYSMNAMRSFFSSIWFVIIPMPNKNKEKVDWIYQFVVNFIASSLGGILAVIVTTLVKIYM